MSSARCRASLQTPSSITQGSRRCRRTPSAPLSPKSSPLKSMEFTTREVFETDHGVGARWTFTAETHAGKTASCDGIDSWRIGTDGSITAIDVYYDPSPLIEALAD